MCGCVNGYSGRVAMEPSWNPYSLEECCESRLQRMLSRVDVRDIAASVRTVAASVACSVPGPLHSNSIYHSLTSKFVQQLRGRVSE